MPNKTRGVGLFTAENIVAVLRAIPESDGTYRDVARKAEQYGGNFQYHTISNWASHGRADIEAGQPSTAYARFTKRYQDLVAEHCGPDTNRNRELDRALEILERTCECGNDKMLLPDGKLGSTCQECQDLDTQHRRLEIVNRLSPQNEVLQELCFTRPRLGGHVRKPFIHVAVQEDARTDLHSGGRAPSGRTSRRRW